MSRSMSSLKVDRISTLNRSKRPSGCGDMMFLVRWLCCCCCCVVLLCLYRTVTYLYHTVAYLDDCERGEIENYRSHGQNQDRTIENLDLDIDHDVSIRWLGSRQRAWSFDENRVRGLSSYECKFVDRIRSLSKIEFVRARIRTRSPGIMFVSFDDRVCIDRVRGSRSWTGERWKRGGIHDDRFQRTRHFGTPKFRFGRS